MANLLIEWENPTQRELGGVLAPADFNVEVSWKIEGQTNFNVIQTVPGTTTSLRLDNVAPDKYIFQHVWVDAKDPALRSKEPHLVTPFSLVDTSAPQQGGNVRITVI